MHSADYAVARYPSVCLSVCPSVCHTPVFSRNNYTCCQTFSTIKSPHRSSFLYRILTETSLTGASNALKGMKNRDFWTISLYLRNDTSNRYYRMPITVSKVLNSTIFNDLERSWTQISRLYTPLFDAEYGWISQTLYKCRMSLRYFYVKILISVCTYLYATNSGYLPRLVRLTSFRTKF